MSVKCFYRIYCTGINTQCLAGRQDESNSCVSVTLASLSPTTVYCTGILPSVCLAGRMNPTLVLVLLLLAVPLQLFFNHYLEQSYSAEESAANVGAPIDGGVNGARVNALEKYVSWLLILFI